MSLLAEILGEIERYRIGVSDADTLEDWVVAHLQLILDAEDAAALRFADGVDVGFVELGEGIIDTAAFRECLAELTAAAPVTARPVPVNPSS